MTLQGRLEKELRRYVDLLIRHYHPEQIVLFGSLAEGKEHPYSDIDLIVVKETTRNFWDRLVEVHRLLQPQVPLHLFVYTPDEWRQMQERLFFQEEVLKKGKVLYDAHSRRS